MILFLVIVVVCCLLQTQASTITMPLRRVKPSTSSRDSIPMMRRSQIPLGKMTGNDPSTPIEIQGLFLPLSTIELGTPPQPFTVIISLHQSDLYVVSFNDMDGHPRHYNSSHSSTHVANGTKVTTDFWNTQAVGIVSEDSVWINGIECTSQLFEEAQSVSSVMALWGVQFEGELGLGPKYGNSTTGSGSLVTSMFKQGLISRNLFSLQLPYTDDDSSGLIFGGTSADIDINDVAMIPVTDVQGGDASFTLTNTWQMSAQSIRLGDGTLLDVTLDGYTAVVESEMPFLELPGDFVTGLHRYMGANRIGWSPIFGLRCDDRAGFADIVFGLGGQEYRMSPYDYTIEQVEDGQHRCYSIFQERGLVDDPDGEKTIFLGSGFLRGFQTVFDLENNEIGFAELLHRQGAVTKH